MAVGEDVIGKFTWLLDEVEVEGVARNVAGDAFDIEPDANYRHIISYLRGNNPLPWADITSPGLLHCEDYVLGASDINRNDSWRLQSKPNEPYQVQLPTGGTRDLVPGDRVRVVGRWVIDHHPEYCDPAALKPPLAVTATQPFRCRIRGALVVGMCHAEFHPFAWDDIRLVEEPAPTGTLADSVTRGPHSRRAILEELLLESTRRSSWPCLYR